MTEQEDYDRFNAWLKQHAPRVLKMDRPFTQEEYVRIKATCDPKITIKVLTAMDNCKPLLKKYVSANRTFLAWYDREMPDGKQKRISYREQEHMDIEDLRKRNNEFLRGFTGSNDR